MNLSVFFFVSAYLLAFLIGLAVGAYVTLTISDNINPNAQSAYSSISREKGPQSGSFSRVIGPRTDHEQEENEGRKPFVF